MIDQNNCMICRQHDVSTFNAAAKDGLPANGYACPACKSYVVPLGVSELIQRLGDSDRKALCGGVRALNDRNQQAIWIYDPQDIIASSRAPKDIFDQLNVFVLYLAAQTEYFGFPVFTDETVDFPLSYSLSQEEGLGVASLAEDLGLLEIYGYGNGTGRKLTARGMARAIELRESSTSSDEVFVAMWFDDSVSGAFTNAILPAIRRCGFKPLRIDLTEHNNKIDDEIVASIRRCRFLIGDFTGHRGGVYFEAGFALGLGIPVIWTCRKDALSETHFDTRQYNHIDWSDFEDLQDRLVNRIRATIPGAILEDASA